MLALLPLHAADFPLTSLDRLDVPTGVAALTTYKGKSALKLTDKNAGPNESIALLKGVQFHDGTIEVDVAGVPAQNADPAARGFIGIDFRIQPGSKHTERIYIRPTNGRAVDQLQRNHSTQYVSEPEWPWQRLRQETPGLYESYVDLQPGEWTRMRIVVKGREASLYISNAEQPCLLVHDMKLGDVSGGVALWSGTGTEAYFRNVNITPAR